VTTARLLSNGKHTVFIVVCHVTLPFSMKDAAESVFVVLLCVVYSCSILVCASEFSFEMLLSYAKSSITVVHGDHFTVSGNVSEGQGNVGLSIQSFVSVIELISVL